MKFPNSPNNNHLPVPKGTIAQAGESHFESWPTLSKHCSTQPMVPSPPQTKILYFLMFRNTYNPGNGPPTSKSNTWYGFSSFRKLEISSRPWQPPDLILTNTSNGITLAGIMVSSILGRSITEKKKINNYLYKICDQKVIVTYNRKQFKIVKSWKKQEISKKIFFSNEFPNLSTQIVF